jgi:hypothetical protein
MSAHADVDLALRAWLHETAPASAPHGLLEALVERTASTPRRRAWSAPGWWRPVGSPVAVPALLPIALVLLAILLAAVAVMVAARPRLPAPFGPARPGLIVYVTDGTLTVAEVDGTAARPLGSVPAGMEAASPAFSRDGTRLAYWRRQDPAADRWELIVAKADGAEPRTVASADFGLGLGAAYIPSAAAWSPDGTGLAYTAKVRGIDTVHVARTDGSGVAPLTDPSTGGSDPAWSPDGRTIAFKGGRNDTTRALYVIPADGSGPARRLSSIGVGGGTALVPAWSPDGRTIAFAGGTLGGEDGSIWTVEPDTGVLTQIDANPGDLAPSWSPDGRHLAWMWWGGYPGGSGVNSIVVEDLTTGRQVVLGQARGAPAQAVLDVYPSMYGSGYITRTVTWAPDGSQVIGYFQPTDSSTDDEFVLFDATGVDPPIVIAAPDVQIADWQRLPP